MNDGQQELVVFIHIPKTGGTTLGNIIDRQYDPKSIFEVYVQRPDTVSEFFALSAEKKETIQCLRGHMPFGLHEHFPGRSPLYITMLRDPVSRTLSEYKHILSDREQWKTWGPPPTRAESLDDYVSWRVEIGWMNLQTRFISGYADMGKLNPPLDSLPEDALERAKENLSKYFVVVGSLKRFDESVLLMKRHLNWTGSLISRRSRLSQGSLPPDIVSAGTLDRIAELNQLDTELFHFGADLLNEQFRRQTGDFARELRRISRLNKAVFVLQQLYRHIPKGLRRLLRQHPFNRTPS